MIDRILFIVKLIIAVLPFVLLCVRSRKVNLVKPDRSRQFYMPIVAVVYAVAVMVLMNPINTWLMKLINSIPAWINALAGLSFIPGELGQLFGRLSEILSNYIRQMNLGFWIFFVANTAIILAYLELKRICLAVVDKLIPRESELHARIAGNFYEYVADKNKWCLLEEYAQARSLMKIFYYGAVAVSVLLMLVSRSFYYNGLIRMIFYPVFGILIVGELYFYLDGATKEEYVRDILGEAEDAHKTVNYTILRKFLRKLFGDKLLTENTGVNNALSDITNDELIRSIEKSEDSMAATYAMFIQNLNSSGFSLDHNYVRSGLELLGGKSILFNNPFYYDLIPYIFYPMNRTLLRHKKILIVLGRHAIEEDIKKWVEDGIDAVTNLPFLWNVEVLGQEPKDDVDVGIITRSDVLDIRLHNSNSEFFEKVEFIVVIEPSKLISTAQIGLNLIVKKCRGEENRNITYCLCDKNCDGLVDAMSHILMTSITEVSATNKHAGTSSYMCWEADDEYLHHRIVPNISRYLGIGTELSFAALKNQVSETRWFGGETFPVLDIRWIDKQYYYDLMQYAGLPTSQTAMDERFFTSPNFWSAKISKNNYFVVEDESLNMFEILRNFATRSTEQGFINVISSDYLLKDYMADNASIFEADPKAIPCIVADYVRSNRNTVLRLALMMSTFPVNADTLKKELSLIGIKVYDLKKQLWYELFLCYSDTKAVSELPSEYEEAVEAASQLTLSGFYGADGGIGIDILEEDDVYNVKCGKLEHTFSIKDPAFMDRCVSELKSAGYIAEDEEGDKYYLGAELCGQIYQKYLPGQFFTFGGKYYEMRRLTADGQILVRRASDHINSRPGYRQIREYTILGVNGSGQIGASRDVSGMKVIKEYADISVKTPGYYSMERYGDFATARKVLFEGEKSGIPERVFHNKEILRIELPDIKDELRYTVTVLLNEVFRTLFAENHSYIVALTADNNYMDNNRGVDPLTYSLVEKDCDLNYNSIYIVEDSQLDLGLTTAVERNLRRILGIIHDYLDWHKTSLETKPTTYEEPELRVSFTPSGVKLGLKFRIVDAIVSFGKAIIDNTIGRIGNVKRIVQIGEGVAKIAGIEPPPYIPQVELIKNDLSRTRKPYRESYYLLYGGKETPANIDIPGTLEYLTGLGLANNPLKQAREGGKAAEIGMPFNPGKADARYCDFCGTEILGVEYETLSDGRDRCMNCGRTAIKTGEEFISLYEDVKRNLEAFFGIRINVGLRVEMMNSRKLHRRVGKTFVPTPKNDGRILGVAIKDKDGYTLCMENGAPRISAMLTIAHELTHIWQYINWDDRAITKKYGKNMRIEVYEGMAKWVEIQYAYLINETATAKREEIITSYRDDEYGRGFLRYRNDYPLTLGTVIEGPTPFMNTEEPLAQEFCGTITYPELPGDKKNDSDKPEDKQEEAAKPEEQPGRKKGIFGWWKKPGRKKDNGEDIDNGGNTDEENV